MCKDSITDLTARHIHIALWETKAPQLCSKADYNTCCTLFNCCSPLSLSKNANNTELASFRDQFIWRDHLYSFCFALSETETETAADLIRELFLIIDKSGQLFGTFFTWFCAQLRFNLCTMLIMLVHKTHCCSLVKMSRMFRAIFALHNFHMLMEKENNIAIGTAAELSEWVAFIVSRATQFSCSRLLVDLWS